jgi:hypothetical protein
VSDGSKEGETHGPERKEKMIKVPEKTVHDEMGFRNSFFFFSFGDTGISNLELWVCQACALPSQPHTSNPFCV